jgi:exopolyphosphatase/guanosine-5'-triphosphate,3'-diphosphate pyrophosphatase
MMPIADFPHVEELIVVGGSASTAVSLLQGNREPFETRIITRTEINALFDQLAALSLAERKQLPGINPQRADILPAGLIILETVFEITAHEKATASTFDLPLGYLLIQNQARHD